MDIETALLDIRRKAALVRHYTSIASGSPEIPDADVLNGVSTICEDIEALARAVARAVPADILAVELRRPR